MRKIPYIEKQSVSLVVVGNTANEAQAIRAVLEVLNFQVEIHWVRSKIELLKILHGDIRTHDYLVLSCHGDEQGIVVPDEPTLTAQELKLTVKLNEHIIINTGCLTGVESVGNAFVSGCDAYIAPSDYIDGDAVLLFVIHLFYQLKKGRSVVDANTLARGLDSECNLFNLYVRV